MSQSPNGSSEISIAGLLASTSPSTLNQSGSLPMLMRVGSMLDSVLESIDEELDASGCTRAASIFNAGLDLLGQAMVDDIATEMSCIIPELTDSATTSTIRLAFCQLTGWLSGVVSSELARSAGEAMGVLSKRGSVGETQEALASSGATPLPGMYL